MTLIKTILAFSSLAGLSNSLSARDFFKVDKCQQQGTNQSDLILKIDTGCIEGTRLDGTRIFRGIPYASPPIGDLRWKPPQSHQPWVSTLNATHFRSTCFQSVDRGYGKDTHPPEGMWPSIQGVNDLSEDCLFMNVLAPSTEASYSHCANGCDFDLKQSYPHRGVCSDNSNTSCSCLDSPNKTVCGPPLTKPAKGFPVMVYFHAGEFQYGSSNDLESNKPPQLPTDVVVVSFNYRIAALGYLGGEPLRPRSPSNSTGNYGMQDQRFALQWVQRNIAQFGGDPDNVMIFGESSGATSVAWHLTSNQSKGLFHKAILESPGLGQTHTMAESKTNFAFLVGLMASNRTLTQCNFTPGVWQEFNCQIMSSRHSSHVLHSANVTSVQEAEGLCAKDASCMGFEFPTHRESGEAFEAQLSTAYLLGDGGYDCDKRYTTRLKGMSMAESNFPNVQKCMLSVPASLLGREGAMVPDTDTIIEDQWAPVVDGVETPVSVEQSISDQHFPTPGVPVLLGSNLDEGSTFMFDTPFIRPGANALEFAEWAGSFSGGGFHSAVKMGQLYAPKTLRYPHPVTDTRVPDRDNYYLSAVRAAGDRSITCPTRNLGQQLSRAGHPVYAYSFLITPKSSVNVSPKELPADGAFHGAEVPFVFNDPTELVRPAEQKVAAAMGCYWTNFAWNSDPNNATGRASHYSQDICGKLPSWEAATQSKFQRIAFNTTGADALIAMLPVDPQTEDRCNFWQSVQKFNADT